MEKFLRNELLKSSSNAVWTNYEEVARKAAKKYLGTKYNCWIEDIVQDVIVKVYLNIDKYDSGRASIEAWIFVVARNLCFDFMEKKGNDPYLFKDLSMCFDLCSFDSNKIEEEEFEVTIRRVLNKLDKRDALMLKLKYFGKKSGREIAEELNLPEKNIPCYMMRAKARLRNLLETEGRDMYSFVA
jgi:RNA polymerase sigma-70 factor (ECF subfamily)